MFVKKHGRFIYIFGCLLFAVLSLAASLADSRFGLSEKSPILAAYKCCVVAACLIFLRGGEYRRRPAAAAAMLAVGLGSVILTAAGSLYAVNAPRPFLDNLWFAFCILASSVSEELYFRGVGVRLAETVSGIRISADKGGIVMLCVGYTLPQLLSGAGGGIIWLLQTALAFSFGLLSLALYCSCRSITVCCTVHFLMSYLSSFTAYNTSAESPMAGLVFFCILHIAAAVYNIAMGLYVFKRSRRYGG